MVAFLVWLGAVTLYLALDWADDIFNQIGANGIPGAGVVKSVVRFVGNMILGLIHLGISVLKPIISDAWTAVGHAADLASQGLSTLDRKIGAGLGDLAHNAWALGAAILHSAQGLVDTAKRDLIKWASDAIGLVESGLSALSRDIVQPLWHFAHDAYDWVTKVAIPAVVDEAKRIEHDLTAAIGMVARDVGGIVTKIGATVDRWAPVIEKAFSWLAWFALHPFDGFISIWTDITHTSGQAILSGLTNAIDQHGQELEDWVVKWLGG